MTFINVNYDGLFKVNICMMHFAFCHSASSENDWGGATRQHYDVIKMGWWL